MAIQKPSNKHSLLIRIGVSVVLLAAAAYVLFLHWHTVSHAVHLARQASIPWLGVALLLMAVTFCIAAGVYRLLALHPLRYRQTVLVEVAAAFVNRLLPSGLGSLGLHGVYLYRRKHTVAEATVVVSVNNILGILAHLVLLACVLAFEPHVLHRFVDGWHNAHWQLVLVIVAVVLVVVVLPPVRRRVTDFARNLLVSIRKLRSRKLLPALLLAMMLTCTYTLVLWAVARSLHMSLGLLQIFIVFSLGMLTGTATPTPGGLVGAEAGLFAGFVTYGVGGPIAAAAVLLYRLVSYWLPLILGVLALVTVRSRKLV